MIDNKRKKMYERATKMKEENESVNYDQRL